MLCAVIPKAEICFPTCTIKAGSRVNSSGEPSLESDNSCVRSNFAEWSKQNLAESERIRKTWEEVGKARMISRLSAEDLRTHGGQTHTENNSHYQLSSL